MATEVIMPKVDMVMDEGTFVEWLKQEGGRVEKGEPLFVILTDKANIELEAPASGILAGLRAQPDDVIPVSEVIAYLLEPGERLPAAAARPTPATPVAAVPSSPAPAGQETGREQSQETGREQTGREQTGREQAVEAGLPAPSEGKVRATPVARRLAAELGLDLTQVPGRGPQGRIHKADVLTFAGQRREVTAPPPAVPALRVALPEARRREVVPLSGPRRIIAERMAHSAFTAPHITLSLRVDMSEAARLRSRLLEPLQQKTGQRLSFTAILARAVAAVLPLHPYLNSSLHGEEIVLWEDVHLGVATSVEDVLIVPVIREAQGKSLEQIVAALGDLTERARARRLTPTEMTGSTFTLSNLGMFGVESFTAIINPPEAAILAMGKIVDTPVSVEGEIVLRPLLNLTLSADHRIVDGVAAARFLADLQTTLENPYLLI